MAVGSILKPSERDSVMKIHKDKELWTRVCPTNQRLFSDYLLYLSINKYTYKTCLAMKSSIWLFLQWNTEYNNNETFYALKKVHFTRFFAYTRDDLQYSYDRIRIIKSHLSNLSDFCEHILGHQEFMPNARGDRNKWYKFTNIVKDVDHGAELTRLQQCNKHTFDDEDIARLEWYLDESRNYEAVVILHFAMLGIDLLDLKRSTVETYNNKLCNKWLKVLDRYKIPFDNAFVIRTETGAWRKANKEDIEKYEELFTAFLGRKFIIC